MAGGDVLGERAAERVLQRDLLGRQLHARFQHELPRAGPPMPSSAPMAGILARDRPRPLARSRAVGANFVRPLGAGPVSDARAIALEGRAEAVAKGWLIALLERTPLPAVEQVSTHVFACEGPSCARRWPGPWRRRRARCARAGAGLSALRAAADPAAAAEALRAVLWAALLETPPEPRADELAAIADRLSHAVAALLSSVLERGAAPPPASSPRRRPCQSSNGGSRRSATPEDRPPCSSSRSTAWRRSRGRGGGAGASRRAQRHPRRGPARRLGRPDEDGRAWVLAAGAGRGAAEALAARMAAAVGALPPPHGAPLTVSAGIALQPEDTREIGSLLARAEESMLAARAAGVPVLAGG